MGKYKKHFRMTVEDALEFVKSKLNFFEKDAKLKGEEIGDGNINYVFRIFDEKTKKSLVLKQADKFLRSSGRPLDLNRSKIESDILQLEFEYSKGRVPKVYYYDDIMCVIAMEDISAYKNLRTEIMDNKIFKNFSNEISDFLVNTLLVSTDLVLDRGEKKELVKKFINKDLCDISEDLVFTEPYTDYKKRNIISKGNEEFVEEKLYSDKELLLKVAIMRNNFLNNSESLIHGDLHLGSIFINETGIKVIDPEFAFYGPIAYDVGNVIGNLFFPLINKKYTSPDQIEVINWLLLSIADIFDMFKDKFSKKYDELVEEKLYKNPLFKEFYINKILSESLTCAGLEIIRRVVGDTKVIEITSIKNSEERIQLERELINIGIYLIKNCDKIKTGKQLLENIL